MKQWKRLTYYLLLNVFVSACTILIVLFFWERTRNPGLENGLALVFGGARPPTPTVSISPTPADTPTPAPTSTPVFIVYTVKSGDTFGLIAEEFGVSIDELMQLNGFTDPNALGVGENLQIPIVTRAAPISSGEVTIDSVIGVSDLEAERILLKHQGDGEISLVGWEILDEDGNVFTFPQFPELILYKAGAVNVLTRAGNNTVVDLYWGLSETVWRAGETVTLQDNQGRVRDTYQIP
jgi:LysM repeat protein